MSNASLIIMRSYTHTHSYIQCVKYSIQHRVKWLTHLIITANGTQLTSPLKAFTQCTIPHSVFKCTAWRDPSRALRDVTHHMHCALRDVTHHMHCATWPITLPSLMATGITRCCRSLYTLKLRNASRMLTLQWQYRQLSHRTSMWYVRRQGKEDNVLTSYNLLYPHHEIHRYTIK